LVSRGHVNDIPDTLKEDTLVKIFVEKFEKQDQRLKDQASTLASNADEIELLKADLLRLQRANNVHVKTTLQQAFDVWEIEYPQGRAAVTVQQCTKAVKEFVAWTHELISPKVKLGEIRAGHIESWVAQLKCEDGNPVAPPTAKKIKAYLSTFFTWAVRRYDLVENPMTKTGTVAGFARHPEMIEAIVREEDLLELIEKLKPEPYWQAWVAVACLAGPRYSEQASLRLEDVFLDEHYIRIKTQSGGRRGIPRKGTKTGRERRVPIEQTVLLPILKKFVARRIKERKSNKSIPALKSDWLFPTMVPDNEYSPREKTPIGKWSHGTTFLRAWDKVALDIAGVPNPKFEKGGDEPEKIRVGSWDFGPTQWRHTFGTALGMCDWNSLEISRVMGNSPAIAERHYVAVASAGKRWGFKW
jgi:integrase